MSNAIDLIRRDYEQQIAGMRIEHERALAAERAVKEAAIAENKGWQHELGLLRDLVRKHEDDRDRADRYERQLVEIGKIIGCGHHDDDHGLARCIADLARERNEARKDIDRLNQMLRDTGYGQGQIDAYASQCEEIETLRRNYR